MTDTETRRKLVGVKPLDLSNVIRHAFLSGVAAARSIPGHCEIDGGKLWMDYEPYEPGSYARVLSALTPSPEAQAEQVTIDIQAARNWTKDAPHENGNYICICCHCGNQFIGHKRRVTCKLCSANSAQEQLKVMREALEFYAEEVLAYAITQAKEPRSAVHADKGKIARDALAKVAALASVTAAAQDDGDAD